MYGNVLEELFDSSNFSHIYLIISDNGHLLSDKINNYSLY